MPIVRPTGIGWIAALPNNIAVLVDNRDAACFSDDPQAFEVLAARTSEVAGRQRHQLCAISFRARFPLVESESHDVVLSVVQIAVAPTSP